MTICHFYLHDVRLIIVELLATRCHMTCCSRINDSAVRRDVRVHDGAVSICCLVAFVLIIVLLVTVVACDMSLLSAPEALYFLFPVIVFLLLFLVFVFVVNRWCCNLSSLIRRYFSRLLSLIELFFMYFELCCQFFYSSTRRLEIFP